MRVWALLTGLILTLCQLAYSVSAQTEQNKNAEAQVKEVTDRAGRLFNEGLLNLKNNRRAQAGEKFDKSVEEFLYSSINVQNNPQMRDCYNQLVETVYRIEFPLNSQQPNIRTLSAACGWSIDNQLADDIAKLVLTVPTTQPQNNNSLVASTNAA